MNSERKISAGGVLIDAANSMLKEHAERSLSGLIVSLNSSPHFEGRKPVFS